MRVLFIGGTGIISSGCTRIAMQQGIELYHFNRGQTLRPVPAGVQVLLGDYRDPKDRQRLLGSLTFDVVVDWIAYTPDQVKDDLDFFRGRTGQYIFISTASAYQKPIRALPITESTPLYNPYWQYSRNKIACEDLLMQTYRSEGYPITIVRPSHTYDPAHVPVEGSYTTIDRMRRGLPVIVPGDGTSLWVLTHHLDFARGFIGLLANPHAIGDAVHITSDELITWNQIYTSLADAAGVQPDLVHIPSELINAYDPDWGAGLIGDKANSVIFDNSKIKRLVPGFSASIPFHQGAREIIAWHDADPSRQGLDEHFNQLTTRILTAYHRARPVTESGQ
ncbi:MAG: SDR family oxidoreductase [Anaerolineaceae bacterium]|nr:SDR family oxidoreductase [Anaerolineaceae bacterium]